jgi:alpha-L-arabinofuranosidase
VSGTASRSGNNLAVTLINRHLGRAADVCVDLGRVLATVEASVLTADSPRAVNSVDRPDRVKPRVLRVEADGWQACRLELPPHSMATLRVS